MNLGFKDIVFKGVFRDYQQRIIDNFDSHIEDGKIHIVASPGSGKTILGLELIRKLGHSTLILSPTITIREQWEERFRSMFCSDSAMCDKIYSNNLRKPSFITSVTYQALYAASRREVDIEKIEEDDVNEEPEVVDFKGFDLRQMIIDNDITTICLDEAHHLKLEWYRVLSELIKSLGRDIFIISLTATPPYDSKGVEWKRYAELCGDIDDEIFVPQLVAQNTLCPHQDYIHFSYPTSQEAAAWLDYKTNVFDCVEQIVGNKYFQALTSHPIFISLSEYEEFNITNYKGVTSILSCLAHSGAVIDRTISEALDYSEKFYPYNIEMAKNAFTFILNKEEIFSYELRLFIEEQLKRSKLIRGKNINLDVGDKLRKKMASSLGKLTSIIEITKSEYKNNPNSLRMLILTDFIKRDLTSIIGTDANIEQISTVTIFESLRREFPHSLRLALLSGSLVIVHRDIMQYVYKIATHLGVNIGEKPLRDSGYMELTFSGRSKQKVALITELFTAGHIDVMIGTKSLLGEGWDAPCINSLILASFVGSYVLSNQMRGRAIRTDKDNPNKSANIWHLVTVEPDEQNRKVKFYEIAQSKNIIHSDDFEQCKQKFENFIAPTYSGDAIESGVSRCDIIKPPFDRCGFDRINTQMLALAEDREHMRQKWNQSIPADANFSIINVKNIPDERVEKIKKIGDKIVFYNIAIVSLVSTIIFIIANSLDIITSLLRSFAKVKNEQTQFMIAILFSILVVGIVIVVFKSKIKKALSPQNRLEKILSSLLSTMRLKGDIQSSRARVEILSSEDGISLQCGLIDATRKDMELFAEASAEMLQSLDNPRYVIYYQTRFLGLPLKIYAESYGVPSIISGRKVENSLKLTH